MKKFLPQFSIMLSLLLCGCSTQETVAVKNSIKSRCNPILVVQPGSNEKYYSGLNRYETQRFFCTKGSTPVHTQILEAACAEAINGNLYGASVLFSELEVKEKNGSVENNLAIIYELEGKYSRAFEMYNSAILLNPRNSLFKKNLYFFLSDRGLLPDKQNTNKREHPDAQR
ncbi:MAG: hypothetical protein GXY14_11230 [Spirochaetes bacterium]|nr:hypothetical protein [Spirochaetota bacterium]